MRRRFGLSAPFALTRPPQHGTIQLVKLSESNSYLRPKKKAANALYVSARTSSGIEGIRKPFKGKASSTRVASKRAFIAYWSK